jgi:hypothetical protein
VGPAGATGPAGSFVQQYDIGDFGPGGGIVFYVSPGGFSCGTDSKTICHYLEASTADLVTSDGSPTMAWSGNTTASVGTGLRIGTGAANTARAVADNSTADSAITVAASFTVNGHDDWFLPSRDELAEMYFQKNAIGGFSSNYWSSSEFLENRAWRTEFGNGYTDGVVKTTGYRVRPVRAF